MAAEDTTGTTSPFLCRDAVALLCNKSRREERKIRGEFYHTLDVPLLNLCLTDFSMLYQLVLACGIRILIACKVRTNRHQLRADFRYIEENRFLESERPIYLLLDAVTLSLVLWTHDPKKIPLLSYANRRVDCSSVLFPHEYPPQNLIDLVRRLETAGKVKDTCVMYCVSFKPYQSFLWFSGHTETCVAPLTIEAFTKADLSIGYRLRPEPKQSARNKMPEEMMQDPYLPNPEKHNKRSAISVNLTALNLAFALGICTREEMSTVSSNLADSVGSLWITFDEENHPRHVVYQDSLRKFPSRQELKCEKTGNEEAWKKLFADIQKSAEILKVKKSEILKPLLERLAPFTDCSIKSKWATCLVQLKQAINTHRVLVFSSDDQALHALKVPLAGFTKTGTSRGVAVHTLANNSVTCLTCPGYMYVNLGDFFEYGMENFNPEQDDAALWDLADQWLSPTSQIFERGRLPMESPRLKHNMSCLKSYPKIQNTAMKTYLVVRATRNINAILDLWKALVEFTFENLGYDISALQRTSNSKRAFDIVWLNYAKRLGPLGHAIEKIHPHIESLIRPWCTGGFTYSCRDFLSQGVPLNRLEEGSEIAASVQEFDLTSSYGYSGKSMAAAKGFGYVFPNTDKRHQSLEYMAVMFQLYKWTTVQKLNLVSVFSNFSPLGVMYIARHPIDLAAITDQGSILLFQIDGHYVHGDYNHPGCSENFGERYVNGATRAEVEAKTMQRDCSILCWMLSTGILNTSYTIVSDCCSPEFSTRALKIAFSTIPELRELVSGVDRLDGTLSCFDPREMTFVAQVLGSCSYQLSHFGPVFTNDLDQPTTFSGSMILTADYYQYMTEFGLDVVNVDWIVYYKRCKILPLVFEWLTELRKQQTDKSKAGIIKNLVNLACGYFGLNMSKGSKFTARVTHKVPRRFNVYKHSVVNLEQTFDGHSYYLVKTYGTPPKELYMCPTPVPLFLSIIEYGKLRLNKALQCIFQYLRPTSVRLLYSNVDNFILASSCDYFEGCLNDPTSDGVWNFCNAWSEFYDPSENPKPGMLKLEFSLKAIDGWRFVSPFCMYYSITSATSWEESLQDRQNALGERHKTASFQGLSSKKAYQLGIDMLNKKPVRIEQTRRVDKVAGTDLHSVLMNF